VLRPNWQLRAHPGRQHLQRQTTLVALAGESKAEVRTARLSVLGRL
jgi:hypothetical protein